jgi:mono/diheme cytochrome c family protein
MHSHRISTPRRRAPGAIRRTLTHPVLWSGLAAVLLLSGCSMLLGVPAQGGMVLFAAAMIAWSAWTGSARYTATAADSPVARLAAGLDAAGERVAAVIQGDGARWAAWSLAMNRDLFEEAYKAGEYILFGDGAARHSESQGVARTAEFRVSGDGFSTEQAAGIVTVADGDLVNPKAGDAAAIESGGGTFNTLCGTYCHGGQAIGGGCPSLVDEFWIHGDSNLEIYKVIAGGAGEGTRMGAFGGRLSGDQIWEIIAYLRHRNKVFLMEKAGPNSFRKKGEQCPNEISLTVTMAGNRTVEGVIIIEDKENLMLEDRSEPLPRQFRVKKNRILDTKLVCVEER